MNYSWVERSFELHNDFEFSVIGKGFITTTVGTQKLTRRTLTPYDTREVVLRISQLSHLARTNNDGA